MLGAEAVFHERAALIAFHLLIACLAIARLHLFLLRGELWLVFAFQALAHEVPPLVALHVLAARLRVAGLHALLLRCLLVALRVRRRR